MRRLEQLSCRIVLIIALMSCSSLAHAAQRIISLKPNITEVLFALGVGDRVVGVTSWCNYPPAAQQLPKVADYLRPNIEAVLALQPDLIIASRENALRRPVEKLRRQGIQLVLVSFQSVDDTFAAIQQIGEAVERTDAADQLVHKLRSDLTLLDRAQEHRPRVLLLVGKHPFVAAGPHSLLGELLEAAGGRNVITAPQPAYPYLSLERIIAAAPDLLIDASMKMGETGDKALPRPLQNLALQQIDVELLRAGPRMGRGVQALRQAMQHTGTVHGSGSLKTSARSKSAQ